MPIPWFHNLPFKALTSFKSLIHITDCHQWYMFDFGPEATEDDRKFVGQNRGTPMKSPESSGMLKGGMGVLETPCPSVNRSVPYFEEFTDSNSSINKDLFGKFKLINKQAL